MSKKQPHNKKGKKKKKIDEEDWDISKIEAYVWNARDKSGTLNYHKLLTFHTWAEIYEASRFMTHGELVTMIKICRQQGAGVFIPHRYYHMVGFFPVPWIEDHYNEEGRCCVCGEKGVSEDWPGPLEDTDHKGRTVLVNRGGYCFPCGVNVHRHYLWCSAEAIVWNKIILNPDHEQTFWRKAACNFIPGVVETYSDPRDTIHGDYSYTHRDRKKPRDTLKKARKQFVLDKIDSLRAEVAKW